MTDKPGKSCIELKLTECQQAQIRHATGQAVSKIELRLHSLREPAETPAIGEDG